MAVGNTDNLAAFKPNTPAGGILKGDRTSVPPTDATSKLDDTFKPLGFVSDKGVSLKPTVATTKKKAWGGTVLKVMTTDKSAELSFSLTELFSPEALTAAYGADNVKVVDATTEHGTQMTLKFDGTLPEYDPYVIEGKDDKRKVRVYVPQFQVTDQGDFVLDDNNTTDLDLKGECLADSDGVLFWVFFEGSDKKAA